MGGKKGAKNLKPSVQLHKVLIIWYNKSSDFRRIRVTPDTVENYNEN